MTTSHPERIGQYMVLGPLGKGGMGVVYKAVQPSLNRLVAIKVLPQEFAANTERVERFRREARAVALLNHPNVVQIIELHDSGEGPLYYVMEFVAGTSLHALLQQRRLSLHEALAVIKELCRGVQAAHRKNIVHRDLNPGNILVSADLAVVKITDWGISRVAAISSLEGTLSTKVSLGTMHYMAPEQGRNMATVDHRADLYSLGVILFEMLTGRIPVGRFSLPSQLNSEVFPELDPIVLKCLNTDPDDRPASVDALFADLVRLEDRRRLGVAQDLRGMGRSTSRLVKQSGATLRRRPVAVLAALALVGLVAAGGLWWVRRGEPPPPPELPAEAPATEPAPVGTESPVNGAATTEAEAAPSAPAVVAEVPPPAEPRRVPAPVPAPSPPAEPAAESEPPESAPEESAPKEAERFAQDLEVARSKLASGLPAQAAADLDRRIAAPGGAPLVLDAYLLKADVQVEQGLLEEAMATYVEAASRFQGQPNAAVARYRVAKVALDSERRDRVELALGALAELARDYADTPWGPRALAEKAELELEHKLFQRDPILDVRAPVALATYRDLIERYPEDRATEAALWHLGGIYEQLDRFELAVGSYTALGVRFPGTRFDAWWRAGELLERRLDDKQAALDAYARVPASSERYESAQKKLDKDG